MQGGVTAASGTVDLPGPRGGWRVKPAGRSRGGKGEIGFAQPRKHPRKFAAELGQSASDEKFSREPPYL